MSDTYALPANAADINTMQLADEELQIDENASAFDFPPPPPEFGNPYTVKLLRGERGLIVKIDDGSKDGKNVPFGQPGVAGKVKHFNAHLELRIVADKTGKELDGKGVMFDNATTVAYGKSNRAFGIAHEALGVNVPRPLTHQSVALALWNALPAEPQCRVNLKWRAYCKSCDLEVAGERNFPQLADGSHRATVPCRKCGNDLQAQARPDRYLPLSGPLSGPATTATPGVYTMPPGGAA